MTEAWSILSTARPGLRARKSEFTASGIAIASRCFLQNDSAMYIPFVNVKNDTNLPRNRKMFRRQFLAVRLGQTKVGLPVSNKVVALDRCISMQVVPAYLAQRTMPHHESVYTAAPLIFPVCRGEVSPLNSMRPLEAVAMKRGTRE